MPDASYAKLGLQVVMSPPKVKAITIFAEGGSRVWGEAARKTFGEDRKQSFRWSSLAPRWAHSNGSGISNLLKSGWPRIGLPNMSDSFTDR